MNMKIDKQNMRKVIMEIPKQFPAGLEAAKDIKIIGDYNQLIFCGMGGSALPAAILKMLQRFYEWPIAIKIHRSYGLPGRISPRALVFIVSYSGNTEETISSYEEAKKRNLTIVGITTGGKLAKLYQKDKKPWVNPLKCSLYNEVKKIQPRSAVGYQFAAIAKILSNSNIIKDLDEDILEISKNLKSKILEKQGKNLAQKIKGKIPIIYASNKFKELAQIWKINFNENSKSPAFWNYFPEFNHNEMEGFEKVQNNFHVIMLQDEKLDHIRVLKRMAVTAKLLKEKEIKTNTINIRGKNLLIKIFSNYIFSQWTSYYLALEYEIDPSPVKTVEEFKKRLG